MLYLGFEPRAAGWQAQTNPLSYGVTLLHVTLFVLYFFSYFYSILKAKTFLLSNTSAW